MGERRGSRQTARAGAEAASANTAEVLQESLRKLHVVESSRDVFAAQAVRLLARTASAQAAALFVCDYRASRVRMVGSFGAEPDVFRPLLTQSGVWIVLRPINERRINVILKAHQNPFVPQTLVTSISPQGLGIGVVPFYKGNLPVGALVLFSSHDTTFSEALLRMLGQALRVCGTALEDAFEVRGLRRPGTVSVAFTSEESGAEMLSPEETAPLQPDKLPADARALLENERQRVSQLQIELETLREAGERLPELQAELERLNEEAQQARAAAEAARARAAKLEAERAEAENRARAAAETLQALIDAREAQQRQIEDTLRLSRAHTDVVADLDTQLRIVSQRALQADEFEDRLRESEAATAELEARLRELSDHVRRSDELDQRLRASEAARFDLEGQVRTLSERARQADDLEEQVRIGASANAELQSQLDRIRDEMAELRAEHQRALEEARKQAEQLDAARADAKAATERFQAAEAERERVLNEQRILHVQLEAVMTERAALRDEVQAAEANLAERTRREAASAAAWGERLSAIEQERDRSRAEGIRLRAMFESTFTRLRAQLEHAVEEKHEIERRLASLAGVEGEAENLRSRVAELQEQLAALRASVDAGAAEAARASNTGNLDEELRLAFGSEARHHIDACRELLSQTNEARSHHERCRSLLALFQRLEGAAAAIGLTIIVEQVQAGESVLEAILAGVEQSNGRAVEFLRRLTDSLDGLVREALGLDASTCRIIDDVERELAILRGVVSRPLRVSLEQRALAPARKRGTNGGDPEAGVLRVEAARLDTLLDAIGQLDISRSRTHREVQAIVGLRDQLNAWRTQLVERDITAEDPEGAGFDRTFQQAVAAQSAHITKQLSRLIDALSQHDSELAAVSCDLQQKVDELRLVPLDTVFRRLRRPVRDAARQQGKIVDLATQGGEIQLDRDVIERLHAPLLHLVRNAVAHGIEAPEIRSGRGKPTRGTVQVAARVVRRTPGRSGPASATPDGWLGLELTVADDGRGLDLEAVLGRALELGLVGLDEPLDDVRLATMIFEPGFSTSEAVNDLAGRGVGMDVVREEIAALRGTVQVESERGQGTTILLKVPVRTAVS